MEVAMLIAHISSTSSLLPFGLSLRSWNSSRIILLISILTACSFSFDMVAYYFATRGVNTYPIGNLFFLVQAELLLLIYREAFSWKMRFVIWAGSVYALLYIINYSFVQSLYTVNSYSIAISCLLFIALSLNYFRFLLKNLPETFVHRSPMIWINIAVLIYFGGSLFIFMLYNYIPTAIWILHNMLNITKNILFFVAIWQSQRKINSISS